MSNATALRVLVVGVTGLVGRAILEKAVGRTDLQIVGLARREIRLPRGARMELVVAEPKQWPEAIAQIAPDVIVIALGTTIGTVGGDRAAFRAVDHDLVVYTAQAAQACGVGHAIFVSSVGADAKSRNFYLSVKGETEDALANVGFSRLDILQPGMLRGRRRGAVRPAEQVGQWLSPVIDLALLGRFRRFRSIRARDLATVILKLVQVERPGRYFHRHDEYRAFLHR